MDLRSESWLGGRRGLVAGIADEHSIAYGCACMFQDCGTKLAVTWLNDKAWGYLGPLARELSATIMMPLDVGQAGATEAVVDCLRERRGRLDFLLNAIAYAPRQSRSDRVHLFHCGHDPASPYPVCTDGLTGRLHRTG